MEILKYRVIVGLILLFFVKRNTPINYKVSSSLRRFHQWYFSPRFNTSLRHSIVSIRTPFITSFNGHLSSGVIISDKYVLTSALPLQTFNDLYLSQRRHMKDNIWDVAGGLYILYTILDCPARLIDKCGYSGPYISNISKVEIYANRPKLRTFNNPSITKDDLALLSYERAEDNIGFICRVKPVYQISEFPKDYAVRMLSLTGHAINGAIGHYGTIFDSFVEPCSVASTWGHFFCVKTLKTIAYGVDSGSPVFSENNTLIGIASFAFNLEGKDKLIYYTNISHFSYRKWIESTVFNKNVSKSDENEQDNVWADDCGFWAVSNLTEYDRTYYNRFTSYRRSMFYAKDTDTGKYDFFKNGGFGNRSKDWTTPFWALNKEIFVNSQAKKP